MQLPFFTMAGIKINRPFYKQDEKLVSNNQLFTIATAIQRFIITQEMAPVNDRLASVFILLDLSITLLITTSYYRQGKYRNRYCCVYMKHWIYFHWYEDDTRLFLINESKSYQLIKLQAKLELRICPEDSRTIPN